MIRRLAADGKISLNGVNLEDMALALIEILTEEALIYICCISHCLISSQYRI